MLSLSDYRYITPKKMLNYLSVWYPRSRKKININAYPSHIFLEPTSRCNSNCRLCPSGGGIRSSFPQGDLTFANAKKIIDTNKEYLFSISFWNWGEPLLNSDIFSMTGYAHKCGIKTALATNLHAFHDGMIEPLFACGLDDLNVSCHAASSETYTQYQPGMSFDTLQNAVDLIAQTKRRLRRSRPVIHLTFAITKKNRHEIREMNALCARFRARPNMYYASLNLRFCKNSDEIQKRIEEWTPDPTRGIGMPGKISYYSTAANTGILPPTYSCCTDPFTTMVIRWNGDVSACCTDYHGHALGNALSQDLKEIWNGRSYVDLRRFIVSGGKTEIDPSAPCNGCVML
ncbi:MAG: radical SAM protein [Chitinivibrionales bacterium]|nr:radical SAM protein [Chitinivibrionales bacterium]